MSGRKSIAAAALAFALAACAHSSGGTAGAGIPSQPHQAMSLLGPDGLDEKQEPLLEDAICQAMVEVNHGDVACLQAQRAAVELNRQRALATGDANTGQEIIDQLKPSPHRVHAVVSRADGKWVLDLSYAEAEGAPPKATQKLATDSFDDLVLKAGDATKALLQ